MKPVIIILFFVTSFLSGSLRPVIAWGEIKGETGGKEENELQKSDISGLLLDVGKKISEIQSIKTDFTQEKDLSAFRKKITLKGRIYLQKPSKLAWYVDEPIKYTVTITDKLIRQWDEDTNEIHEISISGNNVFQNIIDQLSVWFSGNYVSLLENYDAIIKNRQPLVLVFIPKEKNISRKIIRSITVLFRNDLRYLKQIEFQEVSGDNTLIILENTELNIPLDENHFIIKPVKKQAHGINLPGTCPVLFASPPMLSVVSTGVT